MVAPAAALQSMDSAADALRYFMIFRREVCLSRRNNPPEASFFLGDHCFIFIHQRLLGIDAGQILINSIAMYLMVLFTILFFTTSIELSCVSFSYLSIVMVCLVLRFYINTYEFPIHEDDMSSDEDWDSDEDEES